MGDGGGDRVEWGGGEAGGRGGGVGWSNLAGVMQKGHVTKMSCPNPVDFFGSENRRGFRFTSGSVPLR